ncbi:MAG: hypothetical protein JKY23_00485 [Nitrospinaceae bacterium]|nr:hypothetical protein [Nitrospinaceae bacterium]
MLAVARGAEALSMVHDKLKQPMLSNGKKHRTPDALESDGDSDSDSEQEAPVRKQVQARKQLPVTEEQSPDVAPPVASQDMEEEEDELTADDVEAKMEDIDPVIRHKSSVSPRKSPKPAKSSKSPKAAKIGKPRGVSGKLSQRVPLPRRHQKSRALKVDPMQNWRRAAGFRMCQRAGATFISGDVSRAAVYMLQALTNELAYASSVVVKHRRCRTVRVPDILYGLRVRFGASFYTGQTGE